MLKKLLKFILIPLICAVAISILFVAAALIPQNAIQKNASLSAEQLLSVPQWPTVINNGDASYTLDNYTDSQILMQSYNLNMDEPKSVFSNPKHISPANSGNMAVALNEVVNGGAENETYYTKRVARDLQAREEYQNTTRNIKVDKDDLFIMDIISYFAN